MAEESGCHFALIKKDEQEICKDRFHTCGSFPSTPFTLRSLTPLPFSEPFLRPPSSMPCPPPDSWPLFTFDQNLMAYEMVSMV